LRVLSPLDVALPNVFGLIQTPALLETCGRSFFAEEEAGLRRVRIGRLVVTEALILLVYRAIPGGIHAAFGLSRADARPFSLSRQPEQAGRDVTSLVVDYAFWRPGLRREQAVAARDAEPFWFKKDDRLVFVHYNLNCQ